jgi:hypothetical protein
VVKISISDTFVVHHSNLLAIAVRISDDWIQQPVMVANMTYLATFAIMRGIGKSTLTICVLLRCFICFSFWLRSYTYESSGCNKSLE